MSNLKDEAEIANQKLWDELADAHFKSDYYGVERFKQGDNTLKRIEQEELGQIADKSVLHLQCHIGLDSLSLARCGAKVTGVDFSSRSIALARQLSDQTGVKATFVCSEIDAIPEFISDRFDIVFASYGVLCWLKDFSKWASTAYTMLKPGGKLYLIDQHPIAQAFEFPDGQPVLAHPYFVDEQPITREEKGSYGDRNATLSNSVMFLWSNPTGHVITSLVSAGFAIEFVHEFPFCMFAKYECLEERDGYWWFKDGRTNFPLLLSIMCKKP